jgi:hypothetical protein
MMGNKQKKMMLFSILLMIVMAISGCVTSQGNAIGKIIQVDRERVNQKKEDGDSTTEIEEGAADGSTTLKVLTKPEEAEVYIDGVFKGETPLTIKNIEAGFWDMTLEKDGYYPHEITLEVPEGKTVIYEKELVRVTGFLSIYTDQKDVIIEIDTLTIKSENNSVFFQLPVGNYYIKIKKFGYQLVDKKITIKKREVTSLFFDLEKASFNVESVNLPRKRINPENPGPLGDLVGSFRVTAPGKGSVVIKDPEGNILKQINYKEFETWEHQFIWELPEKDIPEGEYSVTVSGSSLTGEEEGMKDVSFRIDRSRIIRYRSLWSDTAGLLYVSAPRALPVLSTQISVLGSAYVGNTGNGLISRIPIKGGIRLGLGSGFEFNTHLSALLFSDYELTTFAAGLSLKKSLFISEKEMFAGSMTAGGTFFSQSRSDTLTDYPGLKFGLPLEFNTGTFSLFVNPQLVFSLTKPFETDFTETSRIYSWAYLRSGLLLDFGSVNMGFSTALRSSPFDEGLGILLPIPVGLELNWMIPKTTAYVSLVGISEFYSWSDFYFMGGLGFGVLN